MNVQHSRLKLIQCTGVFCGNRRVFRHKRLPTDLAMQQICDKVRKLGRNSIQDIINQEFIFRYSMILTQALQY